MSTQGKDTGTTATTASTTAAIKTPRITLADVKPDGIPAELKNMPQWFPWNYEADKHGKYAKVPKHAARPWRNGSSTNPDTWGTFQQAMASAQSRGCTGIGFVFTQDDPYVGIDIDHCRDHETGAILPQARKLVAHFGTYAEVSPSGTGVKIWARQSGMPSSYAHKKEFQDGDAPYEVEVYHSGRWFAVTGHRLDASPHDVRERTKDGKTAVMAFLSSAKMIHERKATSAAPRELPQAPADVQREEDMLRAALACIDADDEGTWFRMACALKAWGSNPAVGDDRARALWDEWSAKSPKFDEAGQASRWDRITAGGGVGVGTVFSAAEDEGYEYGDAMGRDGTAYQAGGSRPGMEWTEELDAWDADGKRELAYLLSLVNAAPAPASASDPDEPARPVVELPNVGGWTRTGITQAAHALGGLFGDGGLYVKAGVVVKVKDGKASDVDASTMQSTFEGKARLVVAREGKNGVRVVPTVATQSQAEAILNASAFHERLPKLSVISKCPVLVEGKDGTLAVARDYDAASGVLVVGGGADEVALDDAKAIIVDALADYDFQSDSDKSRAIAAIITPALVQGGLLDGRAPVDLSEADQSQSGKSYRSRLVAAVYGDVPHVVVQRDGGTGSIEESFSAAALAGRPFISLENVRGKVDSQVIESALTEDTCDCRVPYRRPQQVDMRRVCVMLTSNDACMTRDLTNRMSPVRIRKRVGHQFRKFDGGLDLLGHVKANQPRYLGAVFAVVRAWHAAGKPRTAEARHDFRAWAGALDWIVRNLFGGAPICDGLDEIKARMSSKHAGWFRNLVLAAVGAGKVGMPLRAVDFIRIACEAGIEVPGTGGGDIEDDTVMNSACKGVGQRLAGVFGNRDEATVDGLVVTRSTSTDAQCRTVREYVIGARRPTGTEPSGGGNGQHGVNTGANTGWTAGCHAEEAPGGAPEAILFSDPAIPPCSPQAHPVSNPLLVSEEPRVPRVESKLLPDQVIFVSEKDAKTLVTGKNGGQHGNTGERRVVLAAAEPRIDDGFLSTGPESAGDDTGSMAAQLDDNRDCRDGDPDDADPADWAGVMHVGMPSGSLYENGEA